MAIQKEIEVNKPWLLSGEAKSLEKDLCRKLENQNLEQLVLLDKIDQLEKKIADAEESQEKEINIEI